MSVCLVCTGILASGLFGFAAETPDIPITPSPSGSLPSQAWAWLKQGSLSASARHRVEVFDRDEPAFPHTAEASTLRLAVGYKTPTVVGFSAFAEYEGVYGLGLTDYDVPRVPGQTRIGTPGILDPRGNQLNQGWLRWAWGKTNQQVVITLGRQEFTLNDGRFLSISPWRQNHQSLDAAKLDLGLPSGFGFSYAFVDRVHRVVGDEASDGQPSMGSHLLDLRWKSPDRLNLSAYTLLLDYDLPVLRHQSTSTLGLRLSGPWKLDGDWAIHYAAEGANQQDYGRNPNSVNANYWLGELGMVWRGQVLKAGVAWLGGRSATDKLTTPLAQPFNGWTELFAANPSLGSSHGLRASYLGLSGVAPVLGGITYAATLYDYVAASDGRAYGHEIDWAVSRKVIPGWDKWDIGIRFGYYWAYDLFGDALRTSIYTAWTF